MEGNRTVTDILEELQWRGLIAQHTDIDALRAALADGGLTFYCGFDPTAPSLHHGHLVAVKVMRHLQMAGHHPLALIGGATGLIGDPRTKGERALNTREVVANWATRLTSQLEHLLDFEGDNPARIVNNLDWTGGLSAIDLLRDIGKHFRMGTMLAKDIVARRLASEEGISFTEFSYQILQANDYLELFRRYGCTLEIGGNDQWGNLVGGVDLIHKVEGASVHLMTNPLITKADGTKFGKSEGGAVWLDPNMLSPYAFYQFWLRVEDVDVVRFLKIFTFLDRDEIERLETATAQNPRAREADERAIPHELDWLRTAVHLTKGCYPGQETVARTLNLGKPPRRLAILQLDGLAGALRTYASVLEWAGKEADAARIRQESEAATEQRALEASIRGF